MGLNKKLITTGEAAAVGGTPGTDHFDIVTYTGNGGTQSISSLDFQPDLVWFKRRDVAENHLIVDSIRSVNKGLNTASTNAESDLSSFSTVLSFDSNGFTLGSDATQVVNYNGSSMVAWSWKGASTTTQISASGNQVGADVRVNNAAGFSIVKYNFSSPTSSQTVPHGLNSAPEMIITKCTSSAGAWYTYHKDVGTGKYLDLGSTAAAATYANGFSTVDATAWQQYFRSDAQTHVAYCFHSVSGFSKVGSYTGTGSAGSPTITTGFQPRFVLIKNIDLVQEWAIIDSVRGNNPAKTLYPQSSSLESTSGNNIDFNSDGFTIQDSGSSINYRSGDTFIYLAIA